MGPLDLLRSLDALFVHRLRAALTLLGVAIGTGSIILLASLLHGGETFLEHASQEASDDDVLEVHGDEPPSSQRQRTTRPLSRADADTVAAAEGARSPNVMVAAESTFDTNAEFEGTKKRIAIVSAGASTLSLYRLRVERGRALDDDDRMQARRVCVVGYEIYQDLLRGAPSLADLRLAIDGRLFTVVGVLAKKTMLGATDSTYLWDRKVMIPATTYDAIYQPSHKVTRIYLRNATSRPSARERMRSVLLRRHYGVLNFAFNRGDSATEKLILEIIRVLVIGTGVLALVASGINIMNVMLVTVTERTREIGLRRAIGATPRSILVQFLVEAMSLSFAGAVAGTSGGALLAWGTALLARAKLGSWELAIPAWSVALGVGLAVVTGLVFGILPAWRAARIAPIDALRTE